jgi:sorting nexin-4
MASNNDAMADDDFGSVAWDTRPHQNSNLDNNDASTGTTNLPAHTRVSETSNYDHHSHSTAVQAADHAAGGAASSSSTHLATIVHSVQVKDGKVELEGTSDTFVSYLVTAKVSQSVTCVHSIDSMTTKKGAHLLMRVSWPAPAD